MSVFLVTDSHLSVWFARRTIQRTSWPLFTVFWVLRKSRVCRLLISFFSAFLSLSPFCCFASGSHVSCAVEKSKTGHLRSYPTSQFSATRAHTGSRVDVGVSPLVAAHEVCQQADAFSAPIAHPPSLRYPLSAHAFLAFPSQTVILGPPRAARRLSWGVIGDCTVLSATGPFGGGLEHIAVWSTSLSAVAGALVSPPQSGFTRRPRTPCVPAPGD